MNFNCSTHIFIHSLVHCKAEKNYQLICLPQFLLVLILYEGRVFSEFSIKILNGCIFDIHFDFPHNFKTIYTVQAYEIIVKKAKLFNF